METLTMEDVQSPVAKFFTCRAGAGDGPPAGCWARRHAADGRRQAELPRTGARRAAPRAGLAAGAGRRRRCWPSPSSPTTRCSSGATPRGAGCRCTTRSPRRTWRTCARWTATRERCARTPTTLCATAGSCSAAASASTAARCRRRCSRAGHLAGGGAAQVRAHAGGVRVRGAAARGHRRRHRPAAGGADGRAGHPRGDRLPEDEERLRTR